MPKRDFVREFYIWTERENIKLNIAQIKFAMRFINSMSEKDIETFSGTGTGLSFVLNILERFIKQIGTQTGRRLSARVSRG